MHFHASGQGWRHGVDAGNELGEKQGLLTAAVEIFGGAEDAGLGIGGEAAEQA